MIDGLYDLVYAIERRLPMRIRLALDRTSTRIRIDAWVPDDLLELICQTIEDKYCHWGGRNGPWDVHVPALAEGGSVTLKLLHTNFQQWYEITVEGWHEVEVRYHEI